MPQVPSQPPYDPWCGMRCTVLELFKVDLARLVVEWLSACHLMPPPCRGFGSSRRECSPPRKGDLQDVPQRSPESLRAFPKAKFHSRVLPCGDAVVLAAA